MLRFDAGVIAQHQITSDGYLRAYMRIAKADHALIYRNLSGATKTEICPEAELFKQDSLDSFLMLPITSEHPPVQVDSANYRQHGRGSTGQTLIREVTPIGTFLGTLATIHDGELVSAIVNGHIPGVSPGYRVKTRDRLDGVIEQYDRRGNHVAAVRNPRGGSDIRTVLEGLRSDSDDENAELWVQDLDSGIYRADVGDWILPLLQGEKPATGLVQRGSILLNSGFLTKTDARSVVPSTPAKSESEHDEDDDDCGCDECSQTLKKSKNKSRKRRDGEMTTGATSDRTVIVVDGVPLELSIAQAAVIQPLLNRMDSAETTASSLQDRMDDLENENVMLLADNEQLSELLQEFVNLAEEEGDEEYDDDDDDDEEEDAEDDPLAFDSIESLTEFVADSLDQYLQLDADAQLVGLEFGNRQDAISACLLQTEEVQRQILNAANPNFNTDSYQSSEVLDAVYEVEMARIRAGLNRQDSQPIDYTTPLRAIGAMTAAAQPTSVGMQRYHEQQDAAFIGNRK